MIHVYGQFGERDFAATPQAAGATAFPDIIDLGEVKDYGAGEPGLLVQVTALTAITSGNGTGHVFEIMLGWSDDGATAPATQFGAGTLDVYVKGPSAVNSNPAGGSGLYNNGGYNAVEMEAGTILYIPIPPLPVHRGTVFPTNSAKGGRYLSVLVNTLLNAEGGNLTGGVLKADLVRGVDSWRALPKAYKV